MIAYTDLVQLLSHLEGKYLGNGTRSTHGVPRQAARFIVDRDNVQYFAVDSSQACPAGTLANNLAARVVVAVGANYSQGSGRLPDSSPSGLITVWPYVEDADLRKMRRFLDEYFDCYERDALREVWRVLRDRQQVRRRHHVDRTTLWRQISRLGSPQTRGQ